MLAPAAGRENIARQVARIASGNSATACRIERKARNRQAAKAYAPQRIAEALPPVQSVTRRNLTFDAAASDAVCRISCADIRSGHAGGGVVECGAVRRYDAIDKTSSPYCHEIGFGYERSISAFDSVYPDRRRMFFGIIVPRARKL